MLKKYVLYTVVWMYSGLFIYRHYIEGFNGIDGEQQKTWIYMKLIHLNLFRSIFFLNMHKFTLNCVPTMQKTAMLMFSILSHSVINCMNHDFQFKTEKFDQFA